MASMEKSEMRFYLEVMSPKGPGLIQGWITSWKKAGPIPEGPGVDQEG
jgi:hypothetical protein